MSMNFDRRTRVGTLTGCQHSCASLSWAQKLHELPSEDDQPPEAVRAVRTVRNIGCTVSPGRRAGLWLLRSRLLLDLAHLDNARSTSIGRFLVKRDLDAELPQVRRDST
jgi:hypothetical protein